MVKTARTTMVTAAMAAIAIAMPRTTQAADAVSTEPYMSHVRTTDARIAVVMQTALDRSATFRKMVGIIDASDSYVYVLGGQCSHGVRACFVSLSASTTNRYMRVVVDSRVGELELTRLIAHELRHTIEVIAEPSIRSGEAMYYFYERTAIHAANNTHETVAAIVAGDTVQSEMEKSNRRRGTR